MHDHVSVCLMEDDFGSEQIERIGVSNVLVETDFPHADSLWPQSHVTIEDRVAHLSAADQVKVLRGNAERLFRWSVPELAAR
jgi:predicted TIM-barrel fold metal-dependent hydrolase